MFLKIKTTRKRIQLAKEDRQIPYPTLQLFIQRLSKLKGYRENGRKSDSIRIIFNSVSPQARTHRCIKSYRNTLNIVEWKLNIKIARRTDRPKGLSESIPSLLGCCIHPYKLEISSYCKQCSVAQQSLIFNSL